MRKVMDHAMYQRFLRRLSSDRIKWIARDAAEAAKANPEGINTDYYLDEVAYCFSELARREGLPSGKRKL